MRVYIYLFCLLPLLAFACGGQPYELSQLDRGDPLSRNDDNIIFQTDKSFTYSIRYWSKDKVEQAVLMNQFKLSAVADFPITNIDSAQYYAKDAVSRLVLSVEEATKGNIINPHQTTIFYTFYNILGVRIPFASKTGVVDNEQNIWLHPPRTSTLKVLNLSAYPYVKFPLEVGGKWEYKIPVSREWEHRDFGSFSKEEIILHHSYEVVSEVTVPLGAKNLNCFYITARTKSELGNSVSEFLYNEKYGFVSMIFNNLNGSTIKFDLVN